MVVADDDSGIEAEIGAVVGAAAAGYDTAVAVVAAGDRDFVCKAKKLLQPLEVAGDDVS